MKAKPIEVSQLTKTYKKSVALSNVSFNLTEGSCLGLIGPNGAGKTTLMRIIAGLLLPTSGEVKVFGYNPFEAETKTLIGYMPENADFFEEETADSHIDFITGLRGIRGGSELLSKLHLETTKKVKDFSKGMRKKLSLALATLHDPELLVLDEPTTGLDPQAAVTLYETIREAIRRRKTVIISSHNLYEVEDLCDQILFINKTIRFKGSTQEVDSILRMKTSNNSKAVDLLRKAGFNVQSSGNWITAYTNSPEVVEVLIKNNVNILKMESHKSLYEVFEELRKVE